MDRVFLDANVLFSAAYRPGAGLLELWNLQEVTLLSSRYAFEEARVNLSDEDQRIRLNRLATVIRWFDGSARNAPQGIVLPEKDMPIWLAAIEGRSSHLLTGDVRHFGTYFGKKIEGVAVMLPGEYLRTRTKKS